MFVAKGERSSLPVERILEIDKEFLEASVSFGDRILSIQEFNFVRVEGYSLHLERLPNPSRLQSQGQQMHSF